MPGGNEVNVKSDNLARAKTASGFPAQEKPLTKASADLFANRLRELPRNLSVDEDLGQEQEEEQEESEETNNEDEQKTQLNYATKLLIARKQQIEQQEDAMTAEEEGKKNAEAKQRVAKAALRRGGIAVANSISGALDATGLGFLFGFFVHLGSACELLLEMVYGRHIAKGKSKIIPPISWDPLPISKIDPNAIYLQVMIIAATLALVLAAVVIGAGSFCFIYDYVQFKTLPWQTMTNTASGGGETCLGGIIPTLFGL
jgi:hypothetical protein